MRIKIWNTFVGILLVLGLILNVYVIVAEHNVTVIHTIITLANAFFGGMWLGVCVICREK